MPSAEVSIDDNSCGRSTPRGVDEAIAALAGRQQGVVSAWQLLALGLTRREIDHRVARGSLHPLHHGVYAVGHTAVTQRGRWMAAVLAAGPDAVLSHRSAAALWGLRAGGGADVTAPHRVRRSGITVRQAALAEDERTVVDGIPVTSAARTLFDLAAVLPRAQVERAVHEAEVLRLGGPLSLADLLERHRGRRGAATIRAIVEAGRIGLDVPRSVLEERFHAAVARAGLPRPEVNALVTAGERTFEADCVWRGPRVIAELDGRAVHDTTLRFRTDRTRDRVLAARGWRTIRVTWADLRDDEEALLADLRAVLG